MDKETPKIVRIIRFEDGTLASKFGTEEDARKEADKKKEFYGGSYIII